MFRATRALLFAKTAVKEPTKKKPAAVAAAASSAKVVSKKRDPSLPPPPQRYSLPQLIERIPRPPPDTDKSEWQHKGGWGLKFYRAGWVRYAEPCYWTVTRYKPSTHGHKRKVWGVLTWRGVSEEDVRPVSGCRKREWKYLQEPDGFVIPFTPSVNKQQKQGADGAESTTTTAATTPAT